MADNPYAAPRARVEDKAGVLAGRFLPAGRTVPAGRGWGWISEGYALFRRQALTWVLITVVLVVLMLATGLVPLAGGLVAQLLAPVLTAGLMLGCRDLERHGDLTVGALFAGFSNRAGRLIGLGALGLAAMVLIFAVAGAVFGLGMWTLLGAPPEDVGPAELLTLLLGILVAVAASLPVYMAMWFAPALIALEDLALLAAIRSSFFACLRNILPFLVYGVMLMLLAVLAIIPLGLGLLVLLPVLLASVYASYRDVFFEP
jgi:uncharacterized membrane protein